jgi:hypothetical protein
VTIQNIYSHTTKQAAANSSKHRQKHKNSASNKFQMNLSLALKLNSSKSLGDLKLLEGIFYFTKFLKADPKIK